jgi:hypothetical protein
MDVQQKYLNICDTALMGNHHNTSNKMKIYKDQIYKSQVDCLVWITDFLNITYSKLLL